MAAWLGKAARTAGKRRRRLLEGAAVVTYKQGHVAETELMATTVTFSPPLTPLCLFGLSPLCVFLDYAHVRVYLCMILRFSVPRTSVVLLFPSVRRGLMVRVRG